MDADDFRDYMLLHGVKDTEFDIFHGFHFLKDEGVMAIILPHGVLFRGGAEERIRTKQLNDGHIDTVIGLPAHLFYSTGIPVCILVLKKCKKPNDVLFINAAEHFVKGKRQNQLSTAVGEAEIDLTATHGVLVEIEKSIQMAALKHNGFLKELGLPPLPTTASKTPGK